MIPSNSPVKFREWHEYGFAQFDGRFVLTGEFALNMTDNCEGAGEDCLALDIKPDLAIASRLPHWKDDAGEIWIGITGEKQLVQTIASPRQRAALVAGKIPHVTGRVSIVVDDFSAGGDCDSHWYTARFVKLAQPPKLALTDASGAVGCWA